MGISSGYAITPACLTELECEQIIEALSAEGVLRSRAGARHLMASQAVASLANDARLTGLAREWFGAAAVPFRATLFDKSPKTNWLVPWHQDTALPLVRRFDDPGWGPWSEKAGVPYAHAPSWALARVIALRVHLDGSNADNGPLRVMPGSHELGVLSDDEVAAHAASGEAVACLAGRGAIVAMRPLLIHCSSKGQSVAPRRVLHIEYADSLDLGGNRRLAVV